MLPSDIKVVSQREKYSLKSILRWGLNVKNLMKQNSGEMNRKAKSMDEQIVVYINYRLKIWNQR
jgi:hypothetical protein